MMVKHKDLEIKVINEISFSFDSADNANQYNSIHLADTESKVYQGSNHGIKLFRNGIELSSALVSAVGGSTGIHDHSMIFAENELLIMCANWVFCLTLPDLALSWKTQADPATCFGIHKIDSGYIVHGELEISKLDLHGNIIWYKDGSDIFCTQDGTEDFRIDSGSVYVKDWNGRQYQFKID